MKVTYRGVSYDTQELRNRPTVSKQVSETYRGVKHNETISVEVAK
jgi:hypothetical protein